MATDWLVYGGDESNSNEAPPQSTDAAEEGGGDIAMLTPTTNEPKPSHSLSPLKEEEQQPDEVNIHVFYYNDNVQEKQSQAASAESVMRLMHDTISKKEEEEKSERSSGNLHIDYMSSSSSSSSNKGAEANMQEAEEEKKKHTVNNVIAKTEQLAHGWLPMLTYLCMINKCTVKELQVLMTNLEWRKWTIEHLRHCQIYTTHLRKRTDCGGCSVKEEQQQLQVQCADLSAQNANLVYAFRGYLSITVSVCVCIQIDPLNTCTIGSPILLCPASNQVALPLFAMPDRVWWTCSGVEAGEEWWATACDERGATRDILSSGSVGHLYVTPTQIEQTALLPTAIQRDQSQSPSKILLLNMCK